MSEEDILFDFIKKDKVTSLKDGFHFKNHGRTPMIYFIENKLIVPIYAELPGVNYLDILVCGETRHIKLKYNSENNKWEVIPVGERFRIQSLLLEWLKSKGLRHDIKVGK